jgi:hypothetical protein
MLHHITVSGFEGSLFSLGDYILGVKSDQALEDRKKGRQAEYYIIQYLGMKVDKRWDLNREIAAMSCRCLETGPARARFHDPLPGLGRGYIVGPRRAWHSTGQEAVMLACLTMQL